tara:strand:+ start:360 stop:839 length:480 start_codon:yes stop_codon:yes gene_type:complete
MLYEIIKWAFLIFAGTCIVYSVYKNYDSVKPIIEPLEDDNKDNSSEKLSELDKPPTEEEKKQQMEADKARSELNPMQVNSNNVKFLKRTIKGINKDLENAKTVLEDSFKKVKTQCCSINKHNYKKTCNDIATRSYAICKEDKEKICKPCVRGENPFTCC